MQPLPALLIRADAHTRIGAGHLMRCLALAQHWRVNGGEAVFITACDSPAALRWLTDEGFRVVLLKKSYPDVEEWSMTAQVLEAYLKAWVVLDGYHFDSAYQQKIKETGHALLVVDDLAGLDHYYANIVLNQNVYASQLQYTGETTTRWLMGTDYVLLRREFWPWRTWRREVPETARKILVTMGGGDAENVTHKVVNALQLIAQPDLEAVVVVGGNNPHLQTLQAVIEQSSINIRLMQNVANMPELMAWADIAISAAGSTSWELAYMGLPSLLIVVAANQEPIARDVAEINCALNLGWHCQLSIANLADQISQLLNDTAQQRLLGRNSRQLVDGLGTERVYNQVIRSDKVKI